MDKLLEEAADFSALGLLFKRNEKAQSWSVFRTKDADDAPSLCSRWKDSFPEEEALSRLICLAHKLLERNNTRRR